MSLRPGWPASWKAFINGPWSLLFGSLVLAIGGALVLLLAGRPWE